MNTSTISSHDCNDQRSEAALYAGLMTRFYVHDDRNALGELAARLWDRLRCYAIRSLPPAGRSQTAEDMVAETFLKLLETRGRSDIRWQPAKGNLMVWLSTVLRNAVRTQLRRTGGEAARVRKHADSLDRSAGAERRQARRLDRQRAVSEAIARLPAEHGRIVAMILGGLSQREIAQRLQISTATVSRRVASALEMLRSDLEDESSASF